MDSYLKNYINGAWVDSSGGTRHEVINPATEEPCTEIMLGTTADVDSAVAAAKEAFKTYSQTSREERVALLENIVAEFARLLALGAAELEPVTDVGGGIKVAALRDPFGNRLGIIENPNFELGAVR